MFWNKNGYLHKQYHDFCDEDMKLINYTYLLHLIVSYFYLFDKYIFIYNFKLVMFSKVMMVVNDVFHAYLIFLIFFLCVI